MENETGGAPGLGGHSHDLSPGARFAEAFGVCHQHISRLGNVDGFVKQKIIAASHSP
jgi:hypothetical protein